MYDGLRPPTWRQLTELDIVRKADPVLTKKMVENGKAHYEKNCVSCHAVQPQFTTVNKFGYSFWKTPVTPLQEIGTDPLMVTQFYKDLLPVPELVKKDSKKLGVKKPYIQTIQVTLTYYVRTILFNT